MSMCYFLQLQPRSNKLIHMGNFIISRAVTHLAGQQLNVEIFIVNCKAKAVFTLLYIV